MHIIAQIDVNECEINSHNLCSQAHNEECQNTNGSFACICKEGFQRVDAIQHCLGMCFWNPDLIHLLSLCIGRY